MQKTSAKESFLNKVLVLKEIRGVAGVVKRDRLRIMYEEQIAMI